MRLDYFSVFPVFIRLESQEAEHHTAYDVHYLQFLRGCREYSRVLLSDCMLEPHLLHHVHKSTLFLAPRFQTSEILLVAQRDLETYEGVLSHVSDQHRRHFQIEIGVRVFTFVIVRYISFPRVSFPRGMAVFFSVSADLIR